MKCLCGRETGALTDYAIEITSKYIKDTNENDRKKKGQFFTPKIVAQYMAHLIEQKPCRVLEPCAGTGIILAAICDEICESDRPEIEVDVYEVDEELWPYLNQVIKACMDEIGSTGKKLIINNFKEDFIHSCLGSERFLKDAKGKYDIAILNPPYKKLNSKSELYQELPLDFQHGHANIYTIFLRLAASNLKENGEMVAITPRSYCSGPMFNGFRKWFVNKMSITHLHAFSDRYSIFYGDDVIQEITISHSKKSAPSNDSIEITHCTDGQMNDIRSFTLDRGLTICTRGKDTAIRIPNNLDEAKRIIQVDRQPETIASLGMKASVGPVVPFRTKHLTNRMNKKSVPLIWMQNVNGMQVTWPIDNGKKVGISKNSETNKIITATKNMVLLRRFSSNEMKKRIIAAPFDKDQTGYKYIGIENHVNFITEIDGEMSKELAYGVATYLNSEEIEMYFRAINGHTQVNIFDINWLPFPSKGYLVNLGKSTIEKSQ
jgi:adenine-specific DNA-methyltransferase